MGERHDSRRLAVQALYALEMNPDLTPSDAIARSLEEAGDPAAGADRFLSELVEGAWRKREEVDGQIREVSRRWKLERMDRVDKSVLRLSTHELLHHPETPAQVILNEGVELAKEFGSPDSPAFVNGILDRIAHRHREGDLGGR